MDHLVFVETVDRLGGGVVVTVADATGGRYEAGLGRALSAKGASAGIKQDNLGLPGAQSDANGQVAELADAKGD